MIRITDRDNITKILLTRPLISKTNIQKYEEEIFEEKFNYGEKEK